MWMTMNACNIFAQNISGKTIQTSGLDLFTTIFKAQSSRNLLYRGKVRIDIVDVKKIFAYFFMLI